MKAFSQYFDITVPAGQTYPVNVTGSVLKIRRVSVPSPLLTIQFDGEGAENPMSRNDIIDVKESGDSKDHFRSLLFNNKASVDCRVTFYVGNSGMKFGAENAAPQKYPKGNLGIIDATGALGINAGYVTGVAVKALGSNYVVGDILTAAGGTLISGGVAATFQVTNVGSGGSIRSVSIVTKGQYSVLPAATNVPTGGNGTGCSLSLSFHNPTSALTYSAGSLVIAVGASFTVPGTDNGHQRSSIIFRVSAGTLTIQDANTGSILKLDASDPPVEFNTDSDLVIYNGTGGNVTFVVGEFYFSDL